MYTRMHDFTYTFFGILNVVDELRLQQRIECRYRHVLTFAMRVVLFAPIIH